MTFHDVIDDIVKLIGLPLKSIRPGAEIMVLDVDKENENLQLETSRGQIRSRYYGVQVLVVINLKQFLQISHMLNGLRFTIRSILLT